MYIPGTPDPLVFHAPQLFFECLQQRISAGTRKKRLPNFTTGFVRKEALPLGSFTKYTWHITNIAQVKQIFDSNEVRVDFLSLCVFFKDRCNVICNYSSLEGRMIFFFLQVGNLWDRGLILATLTSETVQSAKH